MKTTIINLMNKYTRFKLVAIISILLLSSCEKIDKEHDEARNVKIENIDFTMLNMGEYTGYYEGGMYGWRENECLVSVDSINGDSSKVVTIKLLSSESDYTQEFLDTMYSRVIRQQSLQVDGFSGATLDSKACLKAVENALLKAKK